MVVGIGGIGGSRVGGQRCAGSPLTPSGRSSPPCGNADDFAASEADHDGATCSNSAVAAIRNRRGCMPHLQIEQNLTIYKIRLTKSVARLRKALEKELSELDVLIDGQIRGSAVWVEKENLLASVPGVGKTIARTLIAELPELGSLDR